MNNLKQTPWPDWQIVRIIGRGSFGIVYEIQRMLASGETESAALKVIKIPQSPADIESMYSEGFDAEAITETFKEHLKGIMNEYELMQKLDGHTNIVNSKDISSVQHDDGMGWDIFIRLELLTPLMQSLPNEITDEMVINLGIDICKALQLCNKHNIIHRDIKPQNIFVSKNGDYKLGDFGIAKEVEKTVSGTKIGTYKYMAPEVYYSQPYGQSADVYSLGLVLYWMLNDRRMPFMPLPPTKITTSIEEESRRRRLSGEPLSPPSHGSEALKQIVLKACAYHPKDRYASADELFADLNAVANGTYIMKPESIVMSGIEEGTIGPAWAENDEKTTGPDWKKPPENGNGKKKKKESRPFKKLILPILLAAILIVGALALIVGLLDFDIPVSPADVPHVITTTTEKTAITEKATNNQQKDEWSDWTDKLPAGVSAEDYEIRERTLYSSRKLETTSSTEKDTMDGWELHHTADSAGDYGAWSDWSTNQETASDTREVQSEIRYRYRDKETTTSTTSSMSGWTLYDTTYSWSDYGSWSSWSTASVSGSDSREVETKKQYSYRDISYTTEYTAWSGWSDWSTTRQSTNDLKKEESRTAWGYYYFQCPSCGVHMHGWDITCPKWAGGCGNAYIPESSAQIIWSTVSWDAAGLKDWHGTGKYYTYIDGQLVFKWPEGGSAQQQYRYATRSTKQVTSYSSWSSYSDTVYTASSTREVREQTVYRYRDRSQVATYHFYRWGEWSDWSTANASASDDRQVENQTYYRYRDKVSTTTYYFQRWSEWSDYSEIVVTPSDSVEVKAKTQYQYKPKAN